MDYYKQKQLIAKVDRKGSVIGKIEKWEAHQKGILHKALTITLIYKDYYILQHRKHPAFNGVFDLTSSSHQLFIKNKLQTTLEASIICLKREWNLTEKDFLTKPKILGAVYYKAKDPSSIYTEHEYCEIVEIKLNKLTMPNLDFAYGFSLVTKEELTNKKSRTYSNLAPWAIKAIEQKLF
jgi:isopentenyl-diphosphate delta-isomerase